MNLANHLYQKGEYENAKSIVDDALLKNPDSITIQLMRMKFIIKTDGSGDLSKEIDEIMNLAKAIN